MNLKFERRVEMFPEESKLLQAATKSCKSMNNETLENKKIKKK